MVVDLTSRPLAQRLHLQRVPVAACVVLWFGAALCLPVIFDVDVNKEPIFVGPGSTGSMLSGCAAHSE